MSNRGKNPNSLKALNEHRHRSGQRNKAAVAFSRSLRELIVQEGESSIKDKETGKRYKKLALLIQQLWSKAMLGEAWAVQMIFERTEGKVKDELAVSAKVEGSITVNFINDGSACKP